MPFIPDYYSVVLFLHGHSSGAEEALDFIPHLLQEGLKQGKRYAAISFDLPNNGYSETFDHTRIAASTATNFPFLPSDNTPITTPILDFIENFVVAFVDAVEGVLIRNGVPRIKHRIAAVIGGSLGGNLGLRLGRRNPMPAWLNQSIVSWSPASVWKAMVKHDPQAGSAEIHPRRIPEARRREFETGLLFQGLRSDPQLRPHSTDGAAAQLLVRTRALPMRTSTFSCPASRVERSTTRSTGNGTGGWPANN